MTLANRLEKIESSGLIRLAQVNPELEYVFRHALVQDATYESLLKADRRSLHSAVGQTLEGLYAERLDEVAATLALHFERAEEYEKAVRYLIHAGEAAARVYAVDEAIELFGRALKLMPASFAEDKLIHFYSQYGRVLELAGRFDAAVEVYEQMRAAGISRKNLQMELDALMSRAILHSTPSPHHSFAVAMELSEAALSIARTLDNREAQSRIYWILMLATLFEGHLQESVSYGEQSLEIARAVGNRERLAFILNDITRAYMVDGLLEKGVAANLEARALWQELGNLPMLVDNLSTQAEYLFFGGEYQRAISVAQEAYEIGKSIHNIWGQTFCLMILGFCYMELGEIDKSIQANQELLSFDPRQTFMIAQISSLGQLAEIHGDFGDRKAAQQYLDSAMQQAKTLHAGFQAAVLAGLMRYELLNENLAQAEQLFEKVVRNYNPRNFMTFIPQYVETARNDLLVYQGEFSAALEALDKVIEILDEFKIRFCRPEFMFRKANALVALGRGDEALGVLESAISLCERIQSRRILWKIYALRSELQSASGDKAAADESRRKAGESLHFLMDHAPADLRRSLMQLPAVTRLLGDQPESGA